MLYVDKETKRSRGFMLVKSNECIKVSHMALVWRWPECSALTKKWDVFGCFWSQEGRRVKKRPAFSPDSESFLEWGVGTNFGGTDVVPLPGATAGF